MPRAYETSHPWLTFSIDLSRVDHRLWLLLGEASSRIEHISGSLLKPDVAEMLHRVFLAKGVHATTAIEGNTLTEDQALQLIEGRLRVPPSQQYLLVEQQNIIDAFDHIRDSVLAGSRELAPATVEDFNRRVLSGLDLEDGVVPGEVRTHSVVVGRYRGAPAEDCEYLLDRLCAWLNGSGFVSDDPALALPLAILEAVAAHLYLAWIHPFGDGNGRTARLLEVQILLAAGVPTPAVHLLSNHYNQTRAEYQRRLDQASRDHPRGVLAFVSYAVQGFVDGLREQLAIIREQQLDDRWEQFVYESFGDANSEPKRRQRMLLLDISKAKRPVAPWDVRGLSPRIAEVYASRSNKTLERDLSALGRAHLLVFELEDENGRVGYVPNRRLIEAFRPVRAEELPPETPSSRREPARTP